MSDRLTPEQLARFRADYHQCGVTVVPLLDEIDALTAERDAARGEWDDLHREAEKLRTMLDERDSEVARLRAAVAEAVTRLGHWRQTARECRSQADDLARRCGVACTREWSDLAERWRWLAEAWERLAALLPPDLLRDTLAAEGGG
jgi:chromosome segregation ATPase